MSRTALILEFLVLYLLLPLGYRYAPVRLPALPVLWAVAGYALWQLLRNPAFDRAALWNAAPLPRFLPLMIALFAGIALLLWFGVHRFAPDLEWSFIRRNPAFWAIVMVAYPVLSVYPQGILYRAFFFSRYATLFPNKWGMILMSAAAFAFLHIIFRNSLAVALTFGGGIIFAALYAESNSMLVAGLLHAAFGCWLFTVGLGQYFYHGTVASVGSVMKK